MRTFA